MSKPIEQSSPIFEPLNWKDFSSNLKTLWDREGSIDRSLKLIADHPEHQYNTGRTGRRQILRVWGEDRLVSGDVIIPERVETPVYVPVANRVMYCVYSTPVFNSNGYSTRSRGVASGLKSAGADVVVVARSGYPWDWKVDTDMPERSRIVSALDGIDYVHLPNGAMDEFSSSAHVEQAADAFVQEALIQRPSFIQAASNYRVALPALIAARRLGIPFVYEVRGLWEITGASNTPGFEKTDRFSAMRDYESRVARAAEHVFAITSQVKDELVSRGVESAKISLAPNAVDPEKFVPYKPTVDMAVSLGLEPGVPVIGFAGSIVKYEGLQTLLEASEILHDRGIEHQLALAGSGNTEQSLRDYCQDKQLDWVRFLGRIPQDQVPVLLSVSDIIVTPRDSTIITELVSALKPLEAFSAGRAVVLSDVAPNVDLAGQDRSRARLFAAGNAVDFADKLEELISNPEARVELAKAARDWIETERNWHAIGRSMLGRIQKLDQESASEGGSSVKLADLKIGLVGGAKIESLLSKHTDIVRLQKSDIELQELASLDFLLIDLSDEDKLGGGDGDNETLISDPEVQDLLLKCKFAGVPRVGLIAEGLNDSTFRVEQAHLLDVCLSGKFEGVVEFLKDPNTVDLRVGIYPPILAVPESEHPQTLRSSDNIWIADADGVRAGSLDALLDLFNSDSSEFTQTETLSVVQDFSDENKLPLSIYVRLETPEMLKRELVSKFGLLIPIVWEAKDATTATLGEVFAEGVSFIEFLAGCHQWQKNPELWITTTKRQKNLLLGAHTLDTRLILLSRALGIPVNQEGALKGDADRPTGFTFATSFGEESMTSLIQEKAKQLAPAILRSLRV